MAYAIAHPERVSRLILYGTVCGEPPTFTPEGLAEEETYRSDDPGRLGEGGSGLPARLHDEVHPRRDRGADALVRRPPADVDVARQRRGQPDRAPAGGPRGRAARITAPTLVLQAIGDRSTTFDNAVRCPSLIPGARLVPLESRNHILLADEPAWRVFIDEVAAFLEPDRRAFETARARAAGRAALAARARRPPARRRRPDERGDRRRPDAQRPNGRAAPVERLREARRRAVARPARPPCGTCATARAGRHRADGCVPAANRRADAGPDWVLARFSARRHPRLAVASAARMRAAARRRQR